MSKSTKNSDELNGVYAVLRDLVGYENVEKIFNHFKGSQINFPTKLYSRDFVMKEALRCYDGTNNSINRVATKYSYSERTIRKLIKKNIDGKQQ